MLVTPLRLQYLRVAIEIPTFVLEAHYRQPVAIGTAQICMAEEIEESILVAGRELGYPFMKQEQVDVADINVKLYITDGQ